MTEESVKSTRVAGLKSRLGQSPSLPRRSLLPQITRSLIARGPFSISFYVNFLSFDSPILLYVGATLLGCNLHCVNITHRSVVLMHCLCFSVLIPSDFECNRSLLGVLAIDEHVRVALLLCPLPTKFVPKSPPRTLPSEQDRI